MNTDLYLISLSQSLSQLGRCQQLLSPDEINKMRRFATPALQEKFALTRGHLRMTLAEYLNTDPKNIIFSYSSLGKPFIKDSPLQFNLAHSGDYCAITLTTHDMIGVDIEYCKPDHLTHVDIAKRFFTEREFNAIQNAEHSKWLFLHIWTQKEAFLKAIGKGLSFGLDRFEVAISLLASSVSDIQDPAYSARLWQSQSFDCLAQYRITVTKENELAKINVFC